jgi:integrase
MTARKSRNRRIDLVLAGVGRIQVSSGTNQRREYERRKQLVRELHADGRLDVLEALKAGAITLVEILAASRHSGARTLAAIVLHRPLWLAVEEALAAMDCSAETRNRYALSWRTLRATGLLGAGARIRDLGAVRWSIDVRPQFGGASDWNHLRRGVSATLSILLGDRMHPFRREVVVGIAWEREREVVPDVTVEAFWRVVDRLPAWARDPVVAIAATGVRVGEYIHADASDLRELTREWHVRGKGDARIVSVADAFWPIVLAAVPARYAPPVGPHERNSSSRRYQRLAGALARATAAEGVRLTLHGLRHLQGQLLSDAGASDGAAADTLGHRSASTTRRYTRRTHRRELAEQAAALLLRRA